MSDAILKQIGGDVREMRGDMKTLLVSMGNHEARISALEKTEEKEGWMRRLVDFVLEAPKLIHICLLAGTLVTAVWGLTHGWLVGKVVAETGHHDRPYVEHRQNRVQEYEQ